MKIIFPSPLPRARDGRQALTILEMLVSVALLSFIIIGLTAMFVETQKAFKAGIKQSDVTDAGRTVINMIAQDLAQMSDPGLTNVQNPDLPAPPGTPPVNLLWRTIPANDLIQVVSSNNGQIIYRTNELQFIIATLHTNTTWYGVCYYVSNWFTNAVGGPIPGVGTLYRWTVQTNGPMTTNNFIYNYFMNALPTNARRVADGVVHLKLYAFDADGNENFDQQNNSYGLNYYPIVDRNLTNSSLYITNYLPHAVDIEVGVLEPEAFEHARALYTAGAIPPATTYLQNAANQVDVFRQHIIIPAAP